MNNTPEKRDEMNQSPELNTNDKATSGKTSTTASANSEVPVDKVSHNNQSTVVDSTNKSNYSDQSGELVGSTNEADRNDQSNESMPLKNMNDVKEEHSQTVIYKTVINNYGNYLHNEKGKIGTNDMAQRPTGTSQYGDSAVVDGKGTVNSKEVTSADFRIFFKQDANPDSLAAMIVLSTFKSVPEELLFQLSDSLKELIYNPDVSDTKDEDDEKEETAPVMKMSWMHTIDELFFPLHVHVELQPYILPSLTVECVSFEDISLAQEIRRYLWRNYPSLRDILVDWLLNLRSNNAGLLNRIMGNVAMQCLADYASMNVDYAKRRIFSRLEHLTAYSDTKFLSAFFECLLQDDDCYSTALERLSWWCNKDVLCYVPYRLYRYMGDYQNSVSDALMVWIKGDMDSMQQANWKDIMSINRRIALLRPAHERKELADLLIELLYQIYASCKRQAEKYRMAKYILELFRWDYLTDYEPKPKMVFLDSIRKGKGREKFLPIFLLIWRDVGLRNEAVKVIIRHMEDIAERNTSDAYLEKVFQNLAFTGVESDYNTTIKALRKCAKQKNVSSIAKHLEEHVVSIRECRLAYGLQ